MAKLYVLKNEQARRIKKNRKWKNISIILLTLVALEHLALAYMIFNGGL